jgi:NAD(P)-dependent dehydrogenase (short-subunit alcohol dehydrogenase family)
VQRFEGRNVIVTGASRGIGRGILDAFIDEGARVFAADVLADGLERLRAEHADADRIETHVCDMGDAAQAREMVRAAVSSMGRIDVLVNNAGVQPDGWARDFTVEDFDLTMAVNVRGPFFAMQEVCAHWVDAGIAGSIVNITSANAFKNESPEAVYNASKAALVALTNAFAHEFGRYGIRVNSVAPGETITPEAEAELANDPDERRLVREYLRRIPLQHTGVPRDQAMAVLFLASDDARFVSAQTLIVDGGELGGGDWYDVADAPPLPTEERPITGR